MTTNPLYFDTAATMPMEQAVVNRMLDFLTVDACFGNPSSSTHVFGRNADNALESARSRIAEIFACHNKEVVFTSGATESINLAIRGLALAYRSRGKHIITSTIEHKATLACCAALEEEGFEVTYVRPNHLGRVDLADIQAALRPDTLLVSLMHVNNETGVIQPIAAIGDYLANVGVMFHVDAAQSVGKLVVDAECMGIDLLSVSGHKFGGPKGVGVLVIRNRMQLKLKPLVYGGGQEFGLRSGTQALHQIMGLTEALSHAVQQQAEHFAHVALLKQTLLIRLQQALPIQVHGDPVHVSPYIVNFSIQGIASEMLINQLAGQLALANGSACSSGAMEPSYVLRAMGIEGDALYGAVRMSFGAFHSLSDINQAATDIIAAAQRIQELMA